jgi:hypothetical protein
MSGCSPSVHGRFKESGKPANGELLDQIWRGH